MKGTILLVEDDQTLRLLGAKQFEVLGIPLDIATCGAEAIQKAANTYDLILMDLGMPDMSGVEATSHIREHELKFRRKRVPIVAMTAYSESAPAYAAGVDDYIQKPVLLEPLRKLVKKWVPAIDV